MFLICFIHHRRNNALRKGFYYGFLRVLVLNWLAEKQTNNFWEMWSFWKAGTSGKREELYEGSKRNWRPEAFVFMLRN